MDTTAQDLFDKLKGQFKNLTLGREDGTRTLIPGEAVFFEFDYHDDESKLGSVVVSLVDEGSLKVYFADNIIDDADSEVKDHWYSFLRGLRRFSTQNMINYEAKNISKQRLDKGDFAYLAKQNKTEEELTMESKLYGGKQRSYQDLNGAKLIIQHHNNVDEDKMGSRSRNVRAVYIENSDGERFKFENNYLPGARAMARHVSNGGYPRDEFGTHISEIMAEMTELRSFVRGVKGKDDYVNEDAQDIIEKATGRYYGLKSTLESISKQRGYKDYFENYEPTNFEVSEDDINDLKQKLTREVFDSKLENSLGAVSKAMKHSTQLQEKKSGDFYDWDDWVRSAKQNGAEIEGDISGAVAIVNGKEIGEWNQDEQDVTGDKIASRFKKPGYGELNVDDSDRADTEEREFIVPGDLQLRGEPTIDAMQYKDSPNLLNLILTDIASRAVDDESANFAAKMAEKIGSVGSTFGQDPKDPAYLADKKKSVALAKMYIAQMKKKDESVEEDEAPFEETTKTDPFEAYAASMDRIAEEVELDEVAASRPRAGGGRSAKNAMQNLKKHKELMDKYMSQGMGKEEASKKAYNVVVGNIEEVELDEDRKNSDPEDPELTAKLVGMVKKGMTDVDIMRELDYEPSSEDIARARLAVGDKEETELDEAKVTKKMIDDLEDRNEHGMVALKLAQAYGTAAEVKKVQDINKRHNQRGHIEHKDQKERDVIIRKYYKMAEEVELDEAAKPDFLDLDGDGDKKEPMKKAAKDKEKKKEVKEGTWHIADDMSGLQELIASGPIPAKDAIDTISDYIGDDDLSDAIGELEKKDPNADARDVIRDFLEQGDMDTYEEVQAVEEEDDMAWLKKAAGIGSGARSNHGIHEGEEGYQITPRSLVAREMRKLQDIAKD